MKFPNRLQTTLWSCHAMVWLAGWIVPRPMRPLWRRTWNDKFRHWCYYLWEHDQLTSQNRRVLASHCWALFPDAWWLRCDRDVVSGRIQAVRNSPLLVLCALALLVTILVWSGGFVGYARTALSSAIPQPDEVCLITLDGDGLNGKYSRIRTDTLLDLASIWSKSKLTQAASPFSWGPAKLSASDHMQATAMARVGPDFFSLLRTQPALGRTLEAPDLSNCPRCVLLSHALWKHEFGADPGIVGKLVTIDGKPRTVAGVLPPNFRLISSGIGVWSLIDPAAPWLSNFERRVGAIARLHKGSNPQRLQRELTDLTEDAGYVHPSSQLRVVTVPAQQRRDRQTLVEFFGLALACALLVVGLRRSTRSAILPHAPGNPLRWLGYLAAKSALVLTVAGLGSWWMVRVLTTALVGSSYPLADELALWIFLPLAIGALSWSVRDQQQRCRTCLRRLEMPVEIGRPGSVLLNWSGTEMVCSAGHGVLYEPDSPANSLDQDRWNTLDRSWEDLFRAG